MMTLFVLLGWLFRIACVAGAVVLLCNHVEHGWGWLLFLAFISGISINTKGGGSASS